MYVDGKAIGIVELEDSRWVQLVDFPVVMFKKDQPTTISFEIMSIYPGTKYQDTAITELVFDGVGVH